MNIRLTVFFDEPFWVGVFERSEGGMLETSRFVFGQEPRDYEVYDFVLRNYYSLDFSRPVALGAEGLEAERRVNPKRLQRIIRRETTSTDIGTKAQQAMKLEGRKASREKREELERFKFEKRQEKKKEKKRGR